MAELPSGTVTFLFTDIEGSTRLWQEHPDAMQGVLARHDELVRTAIESHGGYVVKTTGDGAHAAFATAADAVEAAVAAQLALAAEPWALPDPLRVRMGMHSGPAELRDGDYYGTAVNKSARIMSIAHGGQIVMSNASHELVGEDALGTVDLGEHRLKDLGQRERIFQILHPALPHDFPALRSLDAFPSNLPVALSSFVGRDAELASVARALGEHRLVTLTGVGGVGKTRLATQVAAEVLPRFPDGAWFCELAAALDPQAFVETVAATIGARPQADSSMHDVVVEFLRGRRVLLVLDNCEHLLTPAGRLAADVLGRCPHVRILATSREGLGVDGERVIPLGSLGLPESDEPESIVTSEAVRLFAARGAAVREGFVVDERNVTAVGEICRRLDGIPLAIELAAARLASMSPAEIAGLLDERFRLLTGGKRIAVERHQTLRSTIDWSYGLLGESERTVFDRLGVFVGSFDSAAAVDVAGDDELGRWDVLDALGDLAAKSMLALETSAEDATRYQLLETLRQYAREHLEEAETIDELRRRHAAHYAAWAQEAGTGLVGPDELRWRAALHADLDNLRVAVAWSLDAAEPADREYALRVIAELSFEVGSNRAAGMAPWADRALAFLDDARPELRVGVLGAAAWRAIMALDYEGAHALAAIATGIVESNGETEMDPRFWLALDAAVNVASLYTGHFDEADARMEGLVERFAAAPEREQAWINSLVGATLAMSCLLRGDSTQARERARDALELARHSGSPSAVSLAEYVYGWTTMYSDPDAALAAFDESIRLTRAGAADHSLAHSMVRAAVLRAPTDPARARADLRAALIYASDVGSHVSSMAVLDYGIRITAIAGPADAGAVMIGFVESGGPISLNPVIGDEAVARREAVECIHAGLGEDRYAAMTAQGARLSHDELTAWLVDELSTTIE